MPLNSWLVIIGLWSMGLTGNHHFDLRDPVPQYWRPYDSSHCVPEISGGIVYVARDLLHLAAHRPKMPKIDQMANVDGSGIGLILETLASIQFI